MSQTVDEGRQVRWSQVEEMFFVGNFRGNFVGYIDQTDDGTFRKFDKKSVLRGEASTLESSMAFLNELYFASTGEGDSQ